MLEKLIRLAKVDKFMDTMEYWLLELENGEVYTLSPDLDSLIYRDDHYFQYIDQHNSTDNIHLQVIKLFINNRDELMQHFRNHSNLEAEKFVRGAPYAVIELFKLCSRLFLFPDSQECSDIRNFTMKDPEYDLDINTRLVMRTVKIPSLDFTLKTDLKQFWNYLESLYVEKGSYNYKDICGSWKANSEEDLVGRHFLKDFIEQDHLEDSINSTLRELCRTCSSICGSENSAYSDWYIQVFTSDSEPLIEQIYSVCLLVSVFFLLLTLVVFIVIPHLHKPVHGKCTVFHLVSMVTAYISLTLPQLIKHLQSSQPFFCYVNGHIMQFGFLAMFFWLNVMCFDILLAFSFLRNRKNSLRNDRRERKKLIWYCSYGWGGPTLILAITVFMEYLYHEVPDDDSFNILIGGPKCFFQSMEAQWIFLYGPIGCLILANLIMFAITAVTIYKHSKSSDVLQSEDNSVTSRSNNTRLRVYINLFIIMGANWAAEALSWAFPNNEWVFYITDVSTTLQGLLVFVLFICKPRVIQELRTKFSHLQKHRKIRDGFKTSLSSNKSTTQTQLTRSLDEI